MYDCPIHGPQPERGGDGASLPDPMAPDAARPESPFPGGDLSDDPVFGDLVATLAANYLILRPDAMGQLVTINCHVDEDLDLFTFQVGIGPAANTIMEAERDARQAADDDAERGE